MFRIVKKSRYITFMIILWIFSDWILWWFKYGIVELYGFYNGNLTLGLSSYSVKIMSIVYRDGLFQLICMIERLLTYLFGEIWRWLPETQVEKLYVSYSCCRVFHTVTVSVRLSKTKLCLAYWVSAYNVTER